MLQVFLFRNIAASLTPSARHYPRTHIKDKTDPQGHNLDCFFNQWIFFDPDQLKGPGWRGVITAIANKSGGGQAARNLEVILVRPASVSPASKNIECGVSRAQLHQ
jgi:hypothetical protein